MDSWWEVLCDFIAASDDGIALLDDVIEDILEFLLK